MNDTREESKSDFLDFSPAYNFEENLDQFILESGNIEINIEGTTYKGTGEVRLELFRKAGIRFYGLFNKDCMEDIIDVLNSKKKLKHIIFDKKKLNGFITNFNQTSESDEVEIRLCPSNEPVIGVGEELTEIKNIVFHIFNLENVIGATHSRVRRNRTIKLINIINLKYHHWEIVIKSLYDTDSNIEAVKGNGGYRITHTGSIKRNDGNSFSSKEGKELLDALGYFLSFSIGRICNIVCPVGFNDSGEIAWASWTSPNDYLNIDSWVDKNHGQQIETLFPLFMKFWSNSNWNATFREAIWWYLLSNNLLTGLQACIILTQTALERIAFEYLVNEKNIFSSSIFKRNRASDNINKLLSELNIDNVIPTSITNLFNNIHRFRWQNAAHAITDIRNSLVHPNHHLNSQLDLEIYFDCWKLGIWFLELVFLAICEYDDTYANRLTQKWVGDVEKVPWS